MNIVLVDNDIPILRSLELILCKHGHSVTTFQDPRKALFHFVRENNTQALIVDYSMPLMNGDELLQLLKKEIPVSCRIILISAQCNLRTIIDLDSLGVSAYLHKPVEFHELEHALEPIMHELNEAT
jgi:DNA-binding response OmpR family regulator